MIICKKPSDLSRILNNLKKEGAAIGFVPTMGALHPGHLSLIEACRNQHNLAVCSIFVNPTQFNDPEDFKKYPVTLEKDIDLLESVGCDILFLPEVNDIYPDGLEQKTVFPLGYLETVLEGQFRTGHFQGVCRVVKKLLEIIQPGFLYLGQKDYQQYMVLRKMTAFTGLKTKIEICPTIRETGGLAMSSRNLRLDPDERKKAIRLYEVLSFIRQEIRPGYLQDLKSRALQYLTTEGFKVDYIEIADADTLELITEWDGRQKLVVLVAAFINEIRLIDNMIL